MTIKVVVWAVSVSNYDCRRQSREYATAKSFNSGSKEWLAIC